jgi:hypothetical protein
VVSGFEFDASHKNSWYEDCGLIVGPFSIESHEKVLICCTDVWQCGFDSSPFIITYSV